MVTKNYWVVLITYSDKTENMALDMRFEGVLIFENYENAIEKCNTLYVELEKNDNERYGILQEITLPELKEGPVYGVISSITGDKIDTLNVFETKEEAFNFFTANTKTVKNMFIPDTCFGSFVLDLKNTNQDLFSYFSKIKYGCESDSQIEKVSIKSINKTLECLTYRANVLDFLFILNLILGVAPYTFDEKYYEDKNLYNMMIEYIGDARKRKLKDKCEKMQNYRVDIDSDNLDAEIHFEIYNISKLD